MRKELDDLLCQRYPAIFSERGMSAEESGMHWGFACGDGWFDLIETFCAQVQLNVEQNDMPPVVANQVKEKWGTLSIYYTGGNEITEGMRLMAEALSGRVCELCGCPGQPGRRPATMLL